MEDNGRSVSVGDVTPGLRGELLADGVTRADLESARWVSPYRGFHRRWDLDDPVRQRIVDVAALLPHNAVVGGWAAAYLHGARDLDGRDKPVLALLPPARIIRRQGIAIIRTELVGDDIAVRSGIPCTSGVRTAYDLLRLARGLTEAVVVGDCALRGGLTTRSRLMAYLEDHPGRRGVNQLRAALPLLTAAAASPPESRLRMLCIEAGLPPLLVNVPVYDKQGALLGIPDLLEPESGLVIEYDGAHHRELAQHTADNAREERFEAHGLTVVRVTALDLRDQISTQARIRATYRRLDRRP